MAACKGSHFIMHIYLIGFMAVGKTTIGKKLARALAMPFLDTDKLIEHKTKKTIEQLFEELGEVEFRKLEADVLLNLPTHKPYVIATGGGLPCYYDNMLFMNNTGLTVYLNAEPAFVFSRLVRAKKPRPLVKGLKGDGLLQFITDKLGQRATFYSQSKLTLSLPEKKTESLVNTVVSLYNGGGSNGAKKP
jgi:shikimate kinase